MLYFNVILSSPMNVTLLEIKSFLRCEKRQACIKDNRTASPNVNVSHFEYEGLCISFCGSDSLVEAIMV